jgi:hypothetical protein
MGVLPAELSWNGGDRVRLPSSEVPEAMDIRIQVDPETEPELYDRLRGASQTLEEIVGPRAARFVKAVEWSSSTEPGQYGTKQAVRLKMTDRLSGTVEDSFQPIELRSPQHMRTRLRDVWANFLRQLSHEQMDRMEQWVTADEGD